MAITRHIARPVNRMKLLARGSRRQHLGQVFIPPFFGRQPFPLPHTIRLRITEGAAMRIAENAPGSLSGLYSVTVAVAPGAEIWSEQGRLRCGPPMFGMTDCAANAFAAMRFRYSRCEVSRLVTGDAFIVFVDGDAVAFVT